MPLVYQCSSTCMLLSPVQFIVEDTTEQTILFLTICLDVLPIQYTDFKSQIKFLIKNSTYILLLKMEIISMNSRSTL